MLRDIAWDVGRRFPQRLCADSLCLVMVNPGTGYVFWNISKKTLNKFLERTGTDYGEGRQVVRVYDVTDIIFDGTNAHSYIDIDVDLQSGGHYFHPPMTGRDYVAEIGIINTEGRFLPILRSGVFFSPRDSKALRYSTDGMFTGGYINRRFSVQNIFNAPLYEELNQRLRSLYSDGTLQIVELIPDISGISPQADPLYIAVKEISIALKRLGTVCHILHPKIKTGRNGYTLYRRVVRASGEIGDSIINLFQARGFDLIHCHDWFSSLPALSVIRQLDIPLALTLHSIEHERSMGRLDTCLSRAIASVEERAIEEASVVIVPRADLGELISSLYPSGAGKCVVIPYPYLIHAEGESTGNIDIRSRFSIPPDAPLVLYAGEISHPAGADLLMDAIPTVCRNHRSVRFVFAGEGPMRGELEARALQAGVAERCRFVGHLETDTFMSLLRAAWCVVIPGRLWQDEALARLSIDNGIPVLVTHNSGISCVEHGKNGLITYDNPGSIVWGIQELLYNPLRCPHLIRAPFSRDEGSIETIALRHLLHFEQAIRRYRGVDG